VGSVWKDEYVGAYVGPPWPVTNLAGAFGRTTGGAEWTETPRVTAVAATYDLRRSTSTITEGNFASATQVETDAAQDPGVSECVEDPILTSCTTYYYAVKISNAAGPSALSNVVSGQTTCSGNLTVLCDGDGLGGNEEEGSHIALDLPKVFRLLPGQPNPSRGPVRIAFELPRATTTDITIFDAQGRRVRHLVGGPHAAGRWSVEWDGADARGIGLNPGVYLVRMRAGEFVGQTRLVQLP
jgi:hypothetical protein